MESVPAIAVIAAPFQAFCAVVTLLKDLGWSHLPVKARLTALPLNAGFEIKHKCPGNESGSAQTRVSFIGASVTTVTVPLPSFAT